MLRSKSSLAVEDELVTIEKNSKVGKKLGNDESKLKAQRNLQSSDRYLVWQFEAVGVDERRSRRRTRPIKTARLASIEFHLPEEPKKSAKIKM
jgi:hypothetical protein